MKYLSLEEIPRLFVPTRIETDNPRVYHLVDGENTALAIDGTIRVIVNFDHVFMDNKALTNNKQDNKLVYEFLRCFTPICCLHGYNKKEVMKKVKDGSILLW